MEKQKFSLQNYPQLLKNKYLIAGASIIILILLITLFGGVSSDMSMVPVYKAKKGDFLISLTESGEIRAKKSQTISAPRIRGTLKIVYLIPEGTYVKEGEVVVKFDPTDATTALKEAESKLELALSEKEKLLANQKSAIAQMESQLKSAELSYELSKLNLEQMKFEAEAKQEEAKLQHQKNELSYLQTKQEYESKKIIQKAELNEKEIDIAQKQSEVDKAQRDLDAMTLIAPSEGLVVYSPNWSNNGRKFTVGDTPWRGAVIVNLPDLSAMESVTSVNEVDVSKVQKELEVDVTLDAFQDSVFKGVVSDVASLGKSKERDSQIKVFEIIVAIKDTSDILRPGMTTRNKIIMNEIPNVLTIPLDAVFEGEDGKIVYVKDGSGFREEVVELGEKSEDFIVVTKGLHEGDEVALIDPYDEEAKKEISEKNLELPNT